MDRVLATVNLKYMTNLKIKLIKYLTFAHKQPPLYHDIRKVEIPGKEKKLKQKTVEHVCLTYAKKSLMLVY